MQVSLNLFYIFIHIPKCIIYQYEIIRIFALLLDYTTKMVYKYILVCGLYWCMDF